jgi:hypothetical protein
MQSGISPQILSLSLAANPEVRSHRPLLTHFLGLFGLRRRRPRRRRRAVSALWRRRSGGGGACGFDTAQLVALDAGDHEEGEHVDDCLSLWLLATTRCVWRRLG